MTHTFESKRANQILSGLSTRLTFRELPLPHKLAIIWYMAADGCAWPAFFEDAESMLSSVEMYDDRYGDLIFHIADIPLARLAEEVMKDAQIQHHGTWQNYHAWYVKGGDVPRHGHQDRWPVILSDDDNEEVLDDGWHRLHSYAAQGDTTIPVIYFTGESLSDVQQDGDQACRRQSTSAEAAGAVCGARVVARLLDPILPEPLSMSQALKVWNRIRARLHEADLDDTIGEAESAEDGGLDTLPRSDVLNAVAHCFTLDACDPNLDGQWPLNGDPAERTTRFLSALRQRMTLFLGSTCEGETDQAGTQPRPHI